jgi:KaiC/GvpD/RAD55 family RecA-like ATPase
LNTLTQAEVDLLSNIPPKSIALIQISAEIDEIGLLARFFKTQESARGVYVSSNRPATDLLDRFGQNGFDLKSAVEMAKIIIVDLVSKSTGANLLAKNVLFVHSPEDLSATQLALEKALESMEIIPGESWVLSDSISTLLIYNSPGSVLQFFHFLTGRLRVLQLKGLILSQEGSVEEKTLAAIRHFCDMSIKL